MYLDIYPNQKNKIFKNKKKIIYMNKYKGFFFFFFERKAINKYNGFKHTYLNLDSLRVQIIKLVNRINRSFQKKKNRINRKSIYLCHLADNITIILT